ncbi:hypothetical protein [Pararoseomonas indoligenes]|uniref:Bacterial HORMA domain-containing protein n=1 Tax=Roseomonas indoligenes TaxID=2820811 RepID=A0A940N7N8_9PROT|nr:hypothetical protein [Pararoseomonas indoligenes]MBP0495592.1 hypothetical protein [Pararoseomonas indoligenes]
MTTVVVNSYTHSVAYVADNILKSLKDIIRLSGLDPAKFVDQWESNTRALKTWLETGCGSAWNRDPVGGVIGVQTGPL